MIAIMRGKPHVVVLFLIICFILAACGDKQNSSDTILIEESGAKSSSASVAFNPEEFLPVGSVVLLKGGNKRIMICGRIQAQADTNVIYDYSACYYPEGIIDTSAMFFFNRDAIETVYFRGYEDQEELDYRSNVLDQLGELEIRDGVIVSKDK